MSIEAYQAVWAIRRNGFTSNLRCTLLALAEFASVYNSYTCSASVATIAEMVDTRPRQAQRNLADLEGLGLIRILQNRGRGNTNIYDLSPIMPVKPVMDDTINDAKPVTNDTFNGVKPVIDDRFTPEKTRHAGQEKVSSKAEKVSSGTIKPVTDDTLTVFNHSEPLKENRKTPPTPQGDSEREALVNARFNQAVEILESFKELVGNYKPLALENKTDKERFYAPAMRLAEEFGGDVAAAWLAVRTEYDRMVHDHLTPRYLSAVLPGVLATLSRETTAPPVRANGNGYHSPKRPEIIDPTMPKPGQGGVW